ncbi:MAG TPA: efflux RND transporter periplasmic adaptor subunit [Planctomycetota bacterium]|nr:efflux RND transporter periplasmic adaptor subunit [Planctomycetota bacterium]
MNKILLAVVLCGGLGGAVLAVGPFRGEKKGDGPREGGTYTVVRAKLQITLTEKGTLKTKNCTPLRAETYAKIEWIIDEGKTVKKDEILVKLDKQDTEKQKEQLENQVTQLEAELKSAATNELIQQQQNQTNIEKAELALDVARVELKKFLEADDPSDRRKLALAVESADTDVGRSEDKVKANEELRKEDFVTENDLREAQIQLKKARNDLETAKMEQRSYEEYKRPLELRKKEAAVVEAERGLDQAKKAAEAQLADKTAQVRQRESSLKRTKDQLEKTNEILSKMEIKAPTDGTVLYGDPDQPWERGNIKVGQQVWQGMNLITLPDPSEMAVTLQIHEADVDKLKVGMKAFVTSETQKDKTFDGEVSKIDTVANAGQNWWGGDDVKRFKVEVALTGRDLSLKTGTSARAEIQVGEVDDCLAVPLQAVHEKEGKRFCVVKKGAVTENVEVTIGASNDTMVEIKSGLSEGAQVLLK